MKRFTILPLILLASFALTVSAQEPPADEVGQQASKLEAELGKYKDTSPEAAEVLVKLVDLYYADGRVFGLIRAAETFVAAHPGDRRHQAVMLKLIDGFQVTSRNQEMVATTRQFLLRYAKAPECGSLEIRLADTLVRMNDRAAAADACRLVWNRQPDTPVGRKYGALAVGYYAQAGGANATKGAELGEEILDKSPAGDFAKWIGYQTFYQRYRNRQYAEANVVGNKLLKKGIAADKKLSFDLHYYMAENYDRVGQHANAVEATRRARQIRDRNDLHRRLIERMHSAQAEPSQIEPEVNSYVQKYPTYEDRYRMQGMLALAYLRSGDKARALPMLAEVIKHDAVSNSFADVYVRGNGTEPEQVAATERVLRDALSANPRDAHYLRYLLGFRVYRDRMKDDARVRPVFRELIAQSPHDSYAREALEWLLDNALTDSEFRADVARYITSRKENLHFSGYHRYLSDWVTKARQREGFRDKARLATAELKTANTDVITGLWLKYYFQDTRSRGTDLRILLEPNVFSNLNDRMAHAMADKYAYFLRHYAATKERSEACAILANVCQRFKTDYPLATEYLRMATDYGTPEECKAAAAQMLTLQPQPNSSDNWRRLLTAAQKNEDAQLAKQAFTWIKRAHDQHGNDPGQASSIGDVLLYFEMEKEAVDYWTTYVPFDRRNSESQNCARRLFDRMEGPERIRYAAELARHDTDYLGAYVQWQADEYINAGDLNNFEKVLRDVRQRQDQRPLRGWGFSDDAAKVWIDKYRVDTEAAEADRLRVYRVVRDVAGPEASAQAQLALLESDATEVESPVQRLLAYQETTRKVRNDGNGWNRLMPYAQSALNRKDYQAAATVLTGMLANVPNVGASSKDTARDMVSLCYGRMGAVGLTIDENSPIAPLLKAALALRLGDERLAFETYLANRRLFDEHRSDAPIDLVVFVCEKLIAAGGDENHERVEETLRAWLIKHSESTQFDTATKAKVQLLLARNYYRAQRYDVARSEYTTVMNRYPDSAQAVEAEFGIGETFMAQKVFDQAEQVFEKLANRPEMDIVVRAEFLRGVLALRRGDHEDARDIFRGVLDRVPDISLANQALFSLSEVYGAEQRYLDQLRLLRTVGRLGHHSKRYHAPGMPLSIVVHDSDLGISRGHHRIPVVVTTEPGGDKETVYLTSAGAGRGLFRVDLETRLGSAAPGDRVLQLTGHDVIKSDYPDEFKAEFRTVPLSDVEIHVASDAEFDVASSKIVDEEEESFSAQLEREALEEEEADERVSQGRPANQIKPGNLVYLRVKDADRDVSDDADQAIIKLVADSGDQVQAGLLETGPHSGVFEGTIKTGELPAGALATDASIDHGPLMAIDRDPATFWQSEPDGATPKSLTVDMKDLKRVAQVTVSVPDAETNRPMRAELRGSQDGEFWFYMAGHPQMLRAASVAGECGQMTRRVYNGRSRSLSTWDDVVALTNTFSPTEEEETDELLWTRPEVEERVNRGYVVVWRGTLVQPRSSAARIGVFGATTAAAIDGRLEMPIGQGNRTVDVWLEAGAHDLTIVATMDANRQEVEATWARADLTSAQVRLRSFRAADFDVRAVTGAEVVHGSPDPAHEPDRRSPAATGRPAVAQPAGSGDPRRTAGAEEPDPDSEVTIADNAWQFNFQPAEVRYVRLIVHEYLGEAVAINHVEVLGELPDEVFIPTATDVLSLSTNDVLEIAGGDVVTATYTDEFTQGDSGSSRLLIGKLTATYYNADIAPIAYDFVRSQSGAIQTESKQLLRVDPGERVIVEITDYDEDRTDARDEIRFHVSVNGGEPMELTATETEEYTGVFTKEVDTSAEPAEGKLTVKRGDRILCQYFDTQNTFPGHSVPREAIVFVNEPTEGQIRVLESRVIAPPPESKAGPRIEYFTPDEEKEISGVALAAPITVEVIDPDAAKDSRSSVVVSLVTTDGAKADVRCAISGALKPNARQWSSDEQADDALHEGRFIGQVVLQLGGAKSPDIVPRTTDMPRTLIGEPALDEEAEESFDERLVAQVLNLTGKDIVTASYEDANRPDNEAAQLDGRARLITSGDLECTDRDYREPIERLHVGERMFIKVTDADCDATDERDAVSLEIATENGEKETVSLEETLAHSGVFTGSFLLRATDEPTADNLQPEDPAIESYFGDTIRVRYVDAAATTETGELEILRELPVVIGTDGLVAAFTKTFNDERLAVETKFHIAESYFELFKSHKELGRDEEQKTDLEAGRRLLREVMEDYADPKYAPRIAYLLGQFAQELEQWNEAVESYDLILRRYPDHSLAADAQYKKGQCHEKAGDFDQALEAYVTLAATYPNSPLIASAMIRISDYFYKNERFQVAVQVGEKFLEKFKGHEHAARMAFRVGQCFYKMETYLPAAEAFDRFVKLFPDNQLGADALFWSGESYRQGRNFPEAFRRYNRCRWDFPASDAAKYARGRLAMPEMLRQFELEAMLDDE